MGVTQEIMSKIEIMKGTYDSIRIIDPLKKNILFFSDEGNFEAEEGCYYLWKKNKFCDNCISMRAYLEKDTFVKFEYLNEFVVLLTAIPIVIDDTIYVIELMKDISKTGNYYEMGLKNEMTINDVVEELNNKFILDELTGVYNRRYIDEKLIVELQKSDSNKLPLTILMIELDSFNSIYEEFGIEVSNNVLKDFVTLLKTAIDNEYDWIGRFEENKFVIVLSNANVEVANKIGKKIVNSLVISEFSFSSQNLNTSALYSVLSAEDTKANLSNIYSELIKNIKEMKLKSKYGHTKDGIDFADEDQLLKLNIRIEELRETLNEICATTQNEEKYTDRLKISQYLDELIVEYMRTLYKD